MASRQFRSNASLAGERQTRDSVAPMLKSHGFDIIAEERTVRGTATTQVLNARMATGNLIRMHVRLCWRRDGRNPRRRGQI